MELNESLKNIAREGLDWIQKNRPKGAEVEIYLSRSKERGAEFREGKLNGIQYDSSEGVGLRVFKEGRIGFASASNISIDRIKELYALALAHTPYLEQDAHKGFPKPIISKENGAWIKSLNDRSLFGEDLEVLFPRLEIMQQTALKVPHVVSALRAGYGEMESEVAIENTLGVSVYEAGTSASAGISVMAKDSSEVQVGSAFQSSRRKEALDFQKIGQEAAERGTCLLGSKKLSSGHRSVIFPPMVAVEFLEIISDLLCADQIQRGKSLLAGKLGQKVAAPLVSLMDDPWMEAGLGSSLYDDEGLPTAPKTMIDSGVLKEYFYDFYTAQKEGRSSNGCASRGSFKGLPSPSSSNFYLKPGSLSYNEIISQSSRGIVLMEVMGMHMADPISGEFSVGASGLAVERGSVTHPVKNAMISGNILDILRGIDGIGSDLTFFGSVGSPTFRVQSLMVA